MIQLNYGIYFKSVIIIVIISFIILINFYRFSEKFVRESWIRVIVQAVDYNRDFLSKRLIGNPLLSPALNSPNRSNPTDKRRR